MSVDTRMIRDEELLERLADARGRILGEIRKVIIGQDEVIEQVLIWLFVGGHTIITGVPGLAKTLLVRTLSGVLDLSHPIFNCFFSIKTLDVAPIYPIISPSPEYSPEFWGLMDKDGQLGAIINYNYDVSDFWQWSDDNSFAPIDETNEAYKFGVNYIMYALTH